jgi:para-aminobenzoate synthetase/4-amino-4-deoxychorismate lyase
MSLRVAAGISPVLLFEDPVDVWAPSTMEGAFDALARAQQALNDGYWIAGALSYEFGALMHGVGSRSTQPLLVLGAFREPVETAATASSEAFTLTAPLPRVSGAAYEGAIAAILERIRDGEVYQVNHTVPFDAGFEGDPYALYRRLAERAAAKYCAYVEFDGRALVSISPELFLRFEGKRIATKPMKGTASLERVQDLHDEKNRAEHLMIVDLLRNDLHRICRDVRVDRLFEVERYPTFATMTSTISGELREGASLTEIFGATFPCGSVTGAPKRAAMQHIAALETHPRGFYTGSIGFLSPQRRGWWNVPIRTLQIEKDAGMARYDAGGGIVIDSDARAEWSEILLKSRFLRPACEDFSIWESFRGGTNPGDVEAHLRRLEKSATAFGIAVDFGALRAQIEAINQTRSPLFVRVRAYADRVDVAAEPLGTTPAPVDLCMSRHRVDSADPLLRHKTAWRPVHTRAAQEARERGCFDAVLCNERGEITEGSRTNIFIRRGNTLYTPPLESGVLPGILRERLVSEGQAMERVLTQRDLENADAVYAGNSARGLLPARIR